MAQYENYTPYITGADSIEAVNTLFRKVYQYMAIGLILTSLTAWLTASTPAMLRMFYTSQAPLIIVAVAEIGLVIFLGAAISRLAASTALMLFCLYSVLNGITCSAVLLVYTSESVYTAFLSTAGMFGAMSLYALYTKRDISSWGSFLYMGLFGLIIAMVINMFVGSTAAEMGISIIGIIIFMGLTAYDTAKIKALAGSADMMDGEAFGKIAVIGALELYLDFINLFLYLIRLFGKRRD
ncbi:MAG: Bax inhibitor-1/YccA family protein [Synergistaceae bacterium]|nr:Bax inhibitor-1/YccA family protein [Synergistaceae bacterium]